MVQLINLNQTETEKNIVETNTQNFIQTVIEKSQEIPVVVDFWAPWCGPCKTLTPILEDLAQTYNGSFQLAKVNIDDEKGLAQQFGVRSVPTVYMVVNGNVVDGFMGAQPRSTVEQFLRKHISEIAAQSDDIQDLIDRGQVSQAIRMLKAEGSEESLIRLAGIYLQNNDPEKAQSTLDQVSKNENSAEYKSISASLEFLDIVKNCENESELLQMLQEDEQNWDAHYKLAAIDLVRGDAKSALNRLLHIVRSDRSFNDDAGRIGMIRAFDMLGNNHPLVSEFRRHLATTLN